MIQRSRLLGMGCLIVIAVLFSGIKVPGSADDGAKKLATDDTTDESRRASFIQSMRTMARGLEVVRIKDGGEANCNLVEDAVLNWSDSARHPDLIIPGTTWIWHDNGRPMFIAEIYGRADSVGHWFLFCCNLTSDQVRLSDGRMQKAFTKSYYEPREISGAPAVAETKAERTFQMRQLAGRFDAHQFWEDRYELRLLTKPIYRYEDVEAGVIDGAIFGLVHGTNPEVLLLIEAHGTSSETARWKVGFGALAGAQCIVRLDGNEFWTCPKHVPDPLDPRQSYSKFIP